MTSSFNKERMGQACLTYIEKPDSSENDIHRARKTTYGLPQITSTNLNVFYYFGTCYPDGTFF